MDPTSKQQIENLCLLSRKSLLKIRLHLYMLKLNDTLPEIGPITMIITLGEIILWLCYPPELQSSWTILTALWLSAWLISIALISVPRSKTLSVSAHWIGGD